MAHALTSTLTIQNKETMPMTGETEYQTSISDDVFQSKFGDHIQRKPQEEAYSPAPQKDLWELTKGSLLDDTLTGNPSFRNFAENAGYEADALSLNFTVTADLARAPTKVWRYEAADEDKFETEIEIEGDA